MSCKLNVDCWPGSAYVGLQSKPGAYNPLDVLEFEHRRLTLLCDVLECIADELPGVPYPPLCALAARILKCELPVHHMIEEDCLFPILKRRVRPEDKLDAVLVQLADEHGADNAYASELIEVLEAMAKGKMPENPGMVGYMLRSFFQSYRRHMGIEDRLLLPLARARLTEEDLRDLLASIVNVRLA